MGILFEGRFVEHIEELILSHLDSESLASCCLMSRKWLDFIYTNAEKYESFTAEVNLRILREFVRGQNSEYDLQFLSYIPEKLIFEVLCLAACDGLEQLFRKILQEALRRRLDLNTPTPGRFDNHYPIITGSLIKSILTKQIKSVDIIKVLIEVGVDVNVEDLRTAINPSHHLMAEDFDLRCRVVHLLLLQENINVNEETNASLWWSFGLPEMLPSFAQAWREYRSNIPCLCAFVVHDNANEDTSCWYCRDVCDKLRTPTERPNEFEFWYSNFEEELIWDDNIALNENDENLVIQ